MPETVDHIKDLKPDPGNARRHNSRNVGMIVNSLQAVGAGRSIVIDENDTILAGNATVEAAGLAGIEKVQVVEADGETIIAVRRRGLTPEQKLKLGLFDNRTAELADWDPEVLKLDLDAGLDLSDLFKDEELVDLGAMVLDVAEDPGPQLDRAEELQGKWQVQRGQIWEIPSKSVEGAVHRLMCGDSTKAEDVARVMQGERAQAVVTDPPYGINREGIENDDPEGLRELFDGCLAAMPIENAAVIAFQSPRLEWVWLDACRHAHHKPERLLWMYDENDQTKPWHYWLLCSQAIRITSVGKPEWAQPKAHHDTYTIGLARTIRAGGLGNDFAHASVKPVGVVEDLTAHTMGLVYDPFLGSGTTMVACEQLGRKCRAIEIEPKYCSVTLERMLGLTGKMPVLVSSA